MLKSYGKTRKRVSDLAWKIDNMEQIPRQLTEQRQLLGELLEVLEFREDRESVELLKQLVRKYPKWGAPASRRICLPRAGFSLPGYYGAYSMWPEELEMLSRHAGKGTSYLEVGSLTGATAAYLARAHSHLKITCVDLFAAGHSTQGGIKEVFLKNQSLAAETNPISLLEGASSAILPELAEDSFDCILIDADHAYDAVAEDARNAYRLAKPGGILFFHDYGYVEDTTRAVDGFRFEFGALPILEQQSGLAAIQVPASKDPCRHFFDALRNKWGELPISRTGRSRSCELAKKSDEDLLALWQRHRDETSNSEVRGWYQSRYRERFAGRRVLDFGSGFSVDGVYFAQRGAKVTYADIVAENLEVLSRVLRLLGLDTETYLIDNPFEYRFSEPFDAVLCLGSLINAPFSFARKQVEALKNAVRPGGTVVFLGYPKVRFDESGARNGHEFGQRTDGEATPWVEWYDREKIEALFGREFKIVYERNFGRSGKEFNWFELQRD